MFYSLRGLFIFSSFDFVLRDLEFPEGFIFLSRSHFSSQ
jgi:hypothetical protein